MKTKIIYLLLLLSLGSVSLVRAADHNLPATGNLPSNGSTPVSDQMSTFVTFQLVSIYLGFPKSINDIQSASWPTIHDNGHSEVYDVPSMMTYLENVSLTYGVNYGLSLGEVDGLINVFFTRDPNGLKNGIDAGHPLIAIYGGPSGHIVMVTGYNNDGTYECFDPTTGSYATGPLASFDFLFGGSMASVN